MPVRRLLKGVACATEEVFRQAPADELRGETEAVDAARQGYRPASGDVERSDAPQDPKQDVPYSAMRERLEVHD